MCGLFAFCGSTPDPGILVEVAQRAATRGPHACGWAWEREDGSLAVEKHEGRLEPHIDRVASLVSPLVIGHARLATSGTAGLTANNQPLLAPGLAVAHNGTVDGAGALAEHLGLRLTTGNDSEVILRLMEHHDGDVAASARRALSLIAGKVPHALLAARHGVLIAVAAGHPLHTRHTPQGVYVCSRTFTGSSPISAGDDWGIIRSDAAAWRAVAG